MGFDPLENWEEHTPSPDVWARIENRSQELIPFNPKILAFCLMAMLGLLSSWWLTKLDWQKAPMEPEIIASAQLQIGNTIWYMDLNQQNADLEPRKTLKATKNL